MPRHARRNALILAAWLIPTFPLALWLAHPVFHAARALADVASRKVINAPVNWLARQCGTLDFLFFYQSLLLMGIAGGILLFFATLRRFFPPVEREMRGLWRHRRELKPAFVLCLLCWLTALATGLLGIHLPCDKLVPRSSPAMDWAMAALVGFLCHGLIWRVVRVSLPLRLAFVAGCDLAFMILWQPPSLNHWEPILTSDRFPIAQAVFEGWRGHGFYVQGLPFLILAGALASLRPFVRSPWIPIGLHGAFVTATISGVPALTYALSATAIIVLAMYPARKLWLPLPHHWS